MYFKAKLFSAARLLCRCPCGSPGCLPKYLVHSISLLTSLPPGALLPSAYNRARLGSLPFGPCPPLLPTLLHLSYIRPCLPPTPNGYMFFCCKCCIGNFFSSLVSFVWVFFFFLWLFFWGGLFCWVFFFWLVVFCFWTDPFFFGGSMKINPCRLAGCPCSMQRARCRREAVTAGTMPRGWLGTFAQCRAEGVNLRTD